jgi:hypothetical protein
MKEGMVIQCKKMTPTPRGKTEKCENQKGKEESNESKERWNGKGKGRIRRRKNGWTGTEAAGKAECEWDASEKKMNN